MRLTVSAASLRELFEKAARQYFEALIDIQDVGPALREKIVALCEAVVEADGHLADGETAMLDSLTRAWRQMPGSHRTTEGALS